LLLVLSVDYSPLASFISKERIDMKRVIPALVAAMFALTTPAVAKDFVQDQAGMFSAGTVQQLNTRIGNFSAQTGKEIIVQTVPSVSNGDVRTAAQNAFAQQQINGVLIFVDKGGRKDYILPDRAAVQAGWWTSQTSTSIAQAMEAQFRAGDFDGGITTAVSQTLDIYRSHVGSLRSGQAAQPAYGNRSTYAQQANQGVHISMFWWIIIALFAFFIIRSLMRAAAGPRMYGGYGPGAPGGPGYGPGPGYGGYGWGGGGGFWSGLLGGLGGAWLGNELFGHQNIGTGAWSNVDPTGGQGSIDNAGWQPDPGQADVGGGGGGDWGGGGFGGGDFGGGGGGFGGGDGGGGGGW
jgi:uncharacterized membrane protein YgcG